MWSSLLQDELEKLPKAIEGLKIELYNAYFQFKRRDNIKKSLASLKHREVELIKQREKFKHITCEGYALSCKNKHLICSGTKKLDGSKFFNDYDQHSQQSIDIFLQEFYSNRVDDETIRELSKYEPWKSIWGAGKQEGSIFGKPSSLLSHEQRTIIIWSRIYDSIYESPECPPEEVINDDDCLDGWMLVQSHNREKDKQASHGYKPGDKFNKADEVFIMVDNPDDASRVEAMNTPAAILRKQQRMNALDRAGGILDERYMPDSQNRMREEIMKVQNRRQ